MKENLQQVISALYDDRDHIYWWQSGTLFNAQRGGIDPSDVYMSTDLKDALEQVGYREGRDVIHPNEAPDLMALENYL